MSNFDAQNNSENAREVPKEICYQRKKLYIDPQNLHYLPFQLYFLPRSYTRTILKKYLGKYPATYFPIKTELPATANIIRKFTKKAKFSSYSTTPKEYVRNLRKKVISLVNIKEAHFIGFTSFLPRFKDILYLKGLNKLTLNIDWSHCLQYPKSLSSLSCLEELSIEFQNQEHFLFTEEPAIQRLRAFCKTLCLKKSLETLEMIVYPLKDFPNIKFYDVLFESLNELMVCCFRFEFWIRSGQTFSEKKFSSVFGRSSWVNFQRKQYFPGDRDTFFQKEKKKNEIIFFSELHWREDWSIDPNEILLYCRILKSISFQTSDYKTLPNFGHLESLQKCHIEFPYASSDQLLWNKTFQTMKDSFTKLSQLEEIEFSHFFVGQTNLDVMVEIHQLPCFKRLKSYRVKLDSLMCENKMNETLKNLPQVLKHLEQIQSFSLDFGYNSNPTIDWSLSEVFTNLKELSLNAEKPIEKENLTLLIKNIGMLKDLEKLELSISSPNDNKNIILKQLPKFSKLKELSITGNSSFMRLNENKITISDYKKLINLK